MLTHSLPPPAASAAGDEQVNPSPPAGVEERKPDKPPKKPRKPRQLKDLPSYDPEGYQQFIAAYPRHIALDEAVKAWDWLKPDEALQQTMLTDIEQRKALDRKWAEGFITHPATYLRGRRWTDDIDPIREARASPAVGQGTLSPTAQYNLAASEEAKRLRQERAQHHA